MSTLVKNIQETRVSAQELVNRLFAIVDARNWDDLENVFSPDIIYERPGYAPLIGYQRVKQFYREERVIASGRHYIDVIIADEHRGACCGRFTGTHKNQSAIDERFADMYSFEDGKIKTRTSYFFRPAV
jgi:ketosteroid isomerase-like protein